MGLKMSHVCIDCKDAHAVASFWKDLLGYKLIDESEDGEVEIVLESPNEDDTDLLFVEVPEGKTLKNRIHFDLRPVDQAAEVERAKSLGATEVDIGQGDQTWVVLADVEGNEFCILRALPEN